MESRCSSNADSRLVDRGAWSINTTPTSARDSSEAVEKKCISDVRRTFCLFVTFDLLFISLLWIIELNVNGGINQQLATEVLHYDYHASFFDIFLLAVFRFAALILAYAVCKLRHWWAIAVTTTVCCGFLIVKVIVSKLLSQGAFGYLLPITSFVLAWIETWLLDFKVLPQEAEDQSMLVYDSQLRDSGFESGYKGLPPCVSEYYSTLEQADRAPLLQPGPLSDGQFYSPPESVADSDEELDSKHDPEKGLI